MFVDHIVVHAKAGDGGDGAVSFRREKYVPKGGPDGGDGGKGGDVVLVVDSHTDSLKNFFYKPNLKAPAGGHGGGAQKTGRSGKDLVLAVPAGTVVWREVRSPEALGSDEAQPSTSTVEGNALSRSAGSAERPSGDEDALRAKAVSLPQGPQDGAAPRLEQIADLTNLGDRFVLAKGGGAGRGNVHFKSARNQAPQQATPGERGEEGRFYLELRKIADAGLVGFPNAGKSTLLRRLSAARPKVAAYPFTTLQPMVGVMEFEGFSRGTVADIPGLIEGAHENIGLGHDFLRHIMRCRLLLFVIDLAGSEGRDPVSDLELLRREISLYDETLARKPWFVVANKMDLPEAAEKIGDFRARFPQREVVEVSAETGEGIDALKALLQSLIAHRPE